MTVLVYLSLQLFYSPVQQLYLLRLCFYKLRLFFNLTGECGILLKQSLEVFPAYFYLAHTIPPAVLGFIIHHSRSFVNTTSEGAFGRFARFSALC
jgi:hypothetical protein